MIQGSETLVRMMTALGERTRLYLESEMAIPVNAMADADNVPAAFTLEDMTAVVGIGGPTDLLAAFSFSSGLADALFHRLTDMLGLSPEEAGEFRQAGLAEMANVIAGNWIAEFSPPGTRTTLTPPTLVEGAKDIPHIPRAIYRTLSIATEAGSMSIYLIGPKNKFDLMLNAA